MKGDRSEEELKAEEEKGEEEGAITVFKLNNPPHTCHETGRGCQCGCLT